MNWRPVRFACLFALALTLAVLFLPSSRGATSPFDATCPGCTSVSYADNPSATSWACPFEIGPKWSVSITMAPPTQCH